MRNISRKYVGAFIAAAVGITAFIAPTSQAATPTPAATPTATVIPAVTGVSAMWDPKVGFLVSWTPLASTSGVSSYVVIANPSGATCTASAFANQCVYSNNTVPNPFKPQTPYTFTVVVKSATSASAPSQPSASTAWLGQPDYPTTLVTQTISNTEIDVTWVPGVGTGGAPVYGYKVYAWPYYNTALQTMQQVTGTSAKFTGLTPSTWYEFSVAECNAYGCDTSDPADQYTTPLTATLTATHPPAIISGGNASTTCFNAILNGGTASTSATLTKAANPCPAVAILPASSYPVVVPSATNFPVPAPVNRFTNLSSLMLFMASAQSLTVWAKYGDLMPIAPYFNNYGVLNSQSVVTLTSKTPTTCAISGMNIHLLAAGTCTLTAQTGGDTYYLPSALTTGSFTITK